ncbi:MAG: 2-oxoglutarate dehydrogenase, E2 component, dihydrolipoamide succinyltransferase [Bacteroidota bacterium]|nr:2-oxoglutarate dehydrogenase, E2 component, dihydrolipoamide succinyltransferase [Bacteroidota bacterium]MDP4234031.1 2-oxoglutarate dehydrogenase, E2 component, dihydrolipoamide succinyltransferase [Bacteroidota bacterium]MDP4242897.1 2-oxoglutarate dehydrogenase, E2 component, dihydrolipoamide succinyltransferase [Bacteroidota bacterium]MDP4287664.1 2-oxoglutarate dehydrogenase, E2 component, dihydrolipoamide succinyltransferase [Bacteroidota bacterium]
MATNVVMPKMGESISEGTILRWLKKEGDAVEKDEPILEISTDKVDTEVPSPVAGTLLKILAQEKQTVLVGEPIASIGTNGEVAAPPAKSEAKPAASEAKQAAPAAPAPTQTPTPAPKAEAPAPQPAQGNGSAAAQGQAVVMPKMGESIAEGTVLKWLKKEGDTVEKDEPILEISTDKVDTEVPAPFAGTLTKIVAQEKETVAVGATIAFISSGAASAQAPAPQAPAPQAPAPQAPAPQAPAQQAPPQQAPAQQAPAQQVQQVQKLATAVVSREAQQAPQAQDDRFYSPLVKSIAKAEGVSPQELATITGSGMGGRVNKTDMLAYVEARKSGRVQPVPSPRLEKAGESAPSFAAREPQPMATPSFASSGEAVTVLPMDNIRQRIAEHMVRSVHTSPHVTSISEVDVTNIVNAQKRGKDAFLQRYGVKLTLTPIFIECMVRALREFPFINASIEGTNIIIRNEINFGFAVAMPKQEGSPLPPALIVPVIKHADRLSLAGIAGAMNELANKARTRKLTPDDISGGTFTLTNPGMFGNILSTPIINQPNLAIMTTGAIVKRAVVKTDAEGNDYIAIRSMMFLGLSHDHRLIDGLYAVQFTERVKQYMESYRVEGI